MQPTKNIEIMASHAFSAVSPGMGDAHGAPTWTVEDFQRYLERNAYFSRTRPLRDCSIHCSTWTSATLRSTSVDCFTAALYRSVIQVSFGVAASRARISHIRPL